MVLRKKISSKLKLVFFNASQSDVSLNFLITNKILQLFFFQITNAKTARDFKAFYTMG